jgi:predicted kinase
MATLYVFGGLPWTGKTTLARSLAHERRAVYVRIDTIEQSLRDAGAAGHGPEGYLVAYAVAGENLALGHDVVADSVNPLHVTREAWRAVAARAQVRCVEIEVTCSDHAEHRARVETRTSDEPNLRLPGWADVVRRAYEPWDRPHIVLETSGRSVVESMADLTRSLASAERRGDRDEAVNA